MNYRPYVWMGEEHDNHVKDFKKPRIEFEGLKEVLVIGSNKIVWKSNSVHTHQSNFVKGFYRVTETSYTGR